MKKVMMGLAMALFVAGAAQAQDQVANKGKSHADQQTGRMVKELELNDDQAKKVDAINQKYAEQMKAMRDSRKDERQEMMEKRKSLRDARMQEYKSVLTPEQMEKLTELTKAEEKEHMQQRREMMRKESKPEGMKQHKEQPSGDRQLKSAAPEKVKETK